MRKRAISLALMLILALNMIHFASSAIARNFELEYQWNLAVYSSKSTDEDMYSEYKQPSPNIQSDDPDIIALANSIVKDINGDYEKAGAIYNWVSGNVWYDWDCLEGRTKRGVNSALETYQKRHGICVGYSNLTVALLRATGIPAFVAAGHAAREGRAVEDSLDLSESFRNVNHVWTEAYIDGGWVIMDTTWASNNKLKHGVYSKQQASSQAYFDISLRDLSKTHRYSPNYSGAPYPVNEFVVPYGVESIADYAFWRNKSLKSISLSGSVGAIGYAAFGHCTNLKEVIIPDSVASIGDFAFLHCTSLKGVTIPSSVTKIGKKAFSGCTSLKNIYIPDSVTSIDKDAFVNSHRVRIVGSAGSYAQKFAVSNSIPFTVLRTSTL